MRTLHGLRTCGLVGLLGVALFGCGGPAQAQVRIMPLGDSITTGYEVPGGYRIKLWERFQDAGYNMEFVGSQSNGPPKLGSRNHEGHSGWTIPQLAAEVNGWLDLYTPDIILLHIGTNDCWFEDDVPLIQNRLSALIDQITDRMPNTLVVVARIAPTALDPAYDDKIFQYGAFIPKLVEQKAAEGRAVILADMYNAGVTLEDGVHPDRAGFDLMAEVWFQTLGG